MNFNHGLPPHREMDFSQGIPVQVLTREKLNDSYNSSDGRILDDFPISSIDFDYQPLAPVTSASSASSDIGNLYENMAKQMAAFLDMDVQESRHPKMVNVLLTNLTNVDVIDVIQGGNDEDLINLNSVSMLQDKIPVMDIENHLSNYNGVEPRNLITKDIQSESENLQDIVKKPNQIFQESGWTPLVVSDSLPSSINGDNAKKFVKLSKVSAATNSKWKPAKSF